MLIISRVTLFQKKPIFQEPVKINLKLGYFYTFAKWELLFLIKTVPNEQIQET